MKMTPLDAEFWSIRVTVSLISNNFGGVVCYDVHVWAEVLVHRSEWPRLPQTCALYVDRDNRLDTGSGRRFFHWMPYIAKVTCGMGNIKLKMRRWFGEWKPIERALSCLNKILAKVENDFAMEILPKWCLGCLELRRRCVLIVPCVR